MKKVEVVDTGRLTEKEARMNMEKCAEFLARMIQKYGDAILAELGRKTGDMTGMPAPIRDAGSFFGSPAQKRGWIHMNFVR